MWNLKDIIPNPCKLNTLVLESKKYKFDKAQITSMSGKTVFRSNYQQPDWCRIFTLRKLFLAASKWNKLKGVKTIYQKN